MNNYVPTKITSAPNRNKPIVAKSNPKLKKGQVNADKTLVPRSIPRRIPASPAVRVYGSGCKW